MEFFKGFQPFFVLWVFLALAIPAPARAQQAAPPSQSNGSTPQASPPDGDRRTITAVRLNDGESITLDGRLDEEAWTRAVVATDFIQQDPDNGMPATEQTEVRILFSHDVLYMGVTCLDSQPTRIVSYHRRRDEFITSDDKFAWIIDTYLDGRSAYYFDMTPAGLMGDAVVAAGGMIGSRDWNGIWDARSRISDTGWTMEIAIPFLTLNFDPKSDTWGINFNRTLRRRNELSQWMGWRRNQNLLNPAHAGQLTGISDVSQGIGLEVKPYGLASSQSSPGRGNASVTNAAQAGVDLFYNVTPKLRANLTVNTDFAQTEVDQRQVNLTRFSLFFPEKRDFFLDGSMFFDFGSVTLGGRDNAVVPFFSRQIGLDANGLPQKIDFGTKLTGQTGSEDIGFLQVRTGAENGAPSEDFSVMRLKHRILRQSYVGALYTRRDARGGDGALNTIGVDFLTSLVGRRNVNVGGFYLHSTNPRDTGKGGAWGLTLDYPNDFLTGSLAYREVQENYNPAMGFTLRTGYRRLNPVFSINPRPTNNRWVRKYTFGVNNNVYADPQDNSLLNRTWDFTVFQAEMQSQDLVQAHVLHFYERLERNFPVNRVITLPAGSQYSYSRYSIQASSAPKRRFTISPTVELGQFYSGTRDRLALDVTLRARTGLIFYFSNEWNRVQLAEGRFETRLYRVIGETQFTPRMFVVNTVQSDSVSAVLGWQSRFRWILEPGNDLYVVYTRNWLDDPVLNRFATLDQRTASKIVYTRRF